MPKQIMITDEVYERLLRMKDDRGEKSFTTLLKAMSGETSSRDLLYHELSDAYEELKRKVVGTVQDGMFVGIVERARIITLNLAKMPPKERPKYISIVERSLDILMKKTYPRKDDLSEELQTRKVLDEVERLSGEEVKKKKNGDPNR